MNIDPPTIPDYWQLFLNMSDEELAELRRTERPAHADFQTFNVRVRNHQKQTVGMFKCRAANADSALERSARFIPSRMVPREQVTHPYFQPLPAGWTVEIEDSVLALIQR